MSDSNATNTALKRKPVVLMTMGAQERNGHPYQVMTHKYILPLTQIADCVPVLVPTCCGVEDLEAYLDLADGVYLTGAGSNIDPALYGQQNVTPNKAQDKDRDAFDITLIHAAIERGLPIFAICRGMQEMNVALGGDLHQKVHNLFGYLDHREDSDDAVDVQYGDSHPINLVPGTWFAELMEKDTIPVNSLHGQGVKTLGRGLEPLASSMDGLVEAFHVPGLKQFTLGVQWHPEWRAKENPYSIRIYQAFGAACRARLAERGAY
jgi:putative glutamine amidotransferase